MNLPKYLPFMPGWRLAVGLKALPLEEWIEPDGHFTSHLQEKERLLQERPDEVFASLPGSESAQLEVLDLLVDHLLTYCPQLYERRGDRLHNRLTGQIWNLSNVIDNPLELAGRLVQEDFCLLLPTNGCYRLVAGSVCFPSRWSLREKLGQPIAAIHDPVPGYAATLEHPVDRVMDRLRVDYPGYRLNWSIADTPDLFLPPVPALPVDPAPITPVDAGNRLWLRVERQTLRRLPQSGGVLFTIRTYLHSIAALTTDPAVAQALKVTLDQIPESMQVYKSLQPFRAALSLYLESRARPTLEFEG